MSSVAVACPSGAVIGGAAVGHVDDMHEIGVPFVNPRPKAAKVVRCDSSIP